MFSFHKPRIYRSASGCCICRAKSSSSRFTDSSRYEGDFYACFKLGECRSGDICNACVLLVKRWKKLPKGSQRNWHHVVDARAGHGSKPISRINKVKKPNSSINVITKMKQPSMELTDKMRNVMKKRISPTSSYINSLGMPREHSPGGCSDDVQMDCISSESGSYHSSLAASPTHSEVGEDEVSFNNSARTKKTKIATETGHSHPLANQHAKVISSNGGNTKPNRGRDVSHRQRRNSDASHSSFLDLSFWKREKTCCGIIFKGPCGEVLLDRRFLSPCFLKTVKGDVACSLLQGKQTKSENSGTVNEMERQDNEAGKEMTIPVSVDCISVDSGYDDSSNHILDGYTTKHGNANNFVKPSHTYSCESNATVSKTVSLGVKTNTSEQQSNISSPKIGEISFGSSNHCGPISKIPTN